MSRSQMQICVVGNAPLAAGSAEQIDAADVVIRFNTAPGWPVLAGSKTSTLVLASRSRQLLRQLRGADERLTKLVGSCETICWSHPPRSALFRAAERFAPAFWSRDLSEALAALPLLQDRTIAPFPTASVAQTTRALAHHGKARGWRITPSTGAIVLEALLCMQAVHGAHLHLFGFTWQGWKRHPWPAERARVESLSASAKLTIHPAEAQEHMAPAPSMVGLT